MVDAELAELVRKTFCSAPGVGVLFCSWRRRSRVLLPGVEGSGAPRVGGSGSASWYRSSDSVDWRALRKSIRRKVLNVLFYSWRRSSVLFCSSTV